jgi:hypothetical protein
MPKEDARQNEDGREHRKGRPRRPSMRNEQKRAEMTVPALSVFLLASDLEMKLGEFLAASGEKERTEALLALKEGMDALIQLAKSAMPQVEA